MKSNLEKLLSSIQGMTKETSITFQQQMELATEMAEYYKIQMKICNNEKQAKMMTLSVMKNQIAKMKNDS